MNIAFLITDLAYGGAEVQVVNLASKLRLRGWNVMVVTIKTPIAFVEELEKREVPVKSLNINNKIFGFMAISKLKAILKPFKPDILHCHMGHANLLGRISRYFMKIPVLISTIHSIYDGGPIRMLFYRFTNHLSDLTTIISNIAANRYLKEKIVTKNKLCVVQNGIDITEIPNISEIRESIREQLFAHNKFIWLAVGRLETSKDYPNLLQAVSIIAKENKGFKLLIVGDGKLKSEIVELAKKLQIINFIEFLGIRRDIFNLMSAADAFVMSSAWEGLPMVLLEASALSLPIVATNVGGIPELVLDGVSGFLVPPKDSRALANAMLTIMATPVEKRKQMGLAGHNHVKNNYELNKVVDKWESIYKKLLQNKY